MIFHRILLRRGVTFALGCNDVKQVGSLYGLYGPQCTYHHRQVMTVDGANIVKSEFLEQGAWYDHAFDMFFPATHKAPHL